MPDYTTDDRWRRGPHKHTARRWHGPEGTSLKCDECDWSTGCVGTIREKEDRFREHRSAMGETVKAKRVMPRGERLKQAEAERDRYRLAWQSARRRAEAYGEGILRHVADRDLWKSWAIKQQNRAEKAEAALAEYENVRASVTAGEPLGRALTVSEVMEQYDVTRRALIHELDEGPHLNWRQVITATGRMRRAAFDWRKDFEQAQAERDAARIELAGAEETAAEQQQNAQHWHERAEIAEAELLISRTSLGTPEVRAIAALTPPEDVAAILRQVREIEDAEPSSDGGQP